jgi:hypothetical protein
LKKWQAAFQKEGDTIVQVQIDKRLEQMISTIYEATMVNTGRKDQKTNLEIN